MPGQPGCHPHIWASRLAEMTGMCHRPQPLVEMGSRELFAGSGLEPNKHKIQVNM
jgi:hypothetical protein